MISFPIVLENKGASNFRIYTELLFDHILVVENFFKGGKQWTYRFPPHNLIRCLRLQGLNGHINLNELDISLRPAGKDASPFHTDYRG